MKKVAYTSHAIVRMMERDIEQKVVEGIIDQPDYVRTALDGKKMAVKDVGDRIISVIYIEEERNIRVVTVY